MPKYKVLAGQHMHFDKLYKKGDVIETDLDLLSLFENKFQRVHEQPTVPVKSETPVTPVTVEKVADGNVISHTNPVEKTEPEVNRGVDVTKNFPKAVDEDFLIFREKKNCHYIYDPDDMAAPINKEPLVRSDIEKYIIKYLEE
jgi:hypothetical protein